ncbi:MAG: nuclease-related domain-containing protein, partial [Angustibacter sp.]
MTEALPLKKLRLRYAGICRECGTPLAAHEAAFYDRQAKNVLCLGCGGTEPASSAPVVVAPDQPAPPQPVTETCTPQAEAVVVGTPGASARREHERRKDRRERRIRNAHPHLGGLILALTDDPQSTRAWAVGARGEEQLGQALNGLADRGVLVLHDRRIPRTTANIDHIAVSPTGVYVIDAKRYKNQRPS